MKLQTNKKACSARSAAPPAENLQGQTYYRVLMQAPGSEIQIGEPTTDLPEAEARAQDGFERFGWPCVIMRIVNAVIWRIDPPAEKAAHAGVAL